MSIRYFRFIFFLTLAITIVVVSTMAAIEGMVVGIQNTSTAFGWDWGDLIVVQLPSLKKKMLSKGPCMGPAFSPDGKKIVYLQGNSSNPDAEICFINTDGSSIEPQRSGIILKNSYMDDGLHRMNAMYWVTLSSGGTTNEYIYWMSLRKPDGTKNCVNPNNWSQCSATEVLTIYRFKIGTKNIETVYELPEKAFWGGISADGRRAAATNSNWQVGPIDIVNKTYNKGKSDGCNVCPSPDGKKIVQNLRYGPWGTMHTACMIRDFDSWEQLKVINYDCTGGNCRWSHHDTSIIMWLNTNELGTACLSDSQHLLNHGVIHNIHSGERLNIGQIVGFDYYPSSIGVFPERVSEPVFNPSAGAIAARSFTLKLKTSTPGASIRYTLDGSEPTPTHGIEIASSEGTCTVVPGTLEAQRYVKAIAYKSGMLPSIVISSGYYATSFNPSFYIFTPDSADTVYIGDTMTIGWFGNSTTDYSAGVSIYLSLDAGKSWPFGTINNNPIKPGTTEWANYRWKVPQELEGKSLLSKQAVVKVELYGQSAVSGISKPFNIVAASSADLRQKILGRNASAITRRGSQLLLPLNVTNAILLSTKGHIVNPKRLKSNSAIIVPEVKPGQYYIRLNFKNGSSQTIPLLIIR